MVTPVYGLPMFASPALRQFGPKTNWDRKPDSDQSQIWTQFQKSAQIISLINLIT